jgi:hypothetical protein
MEPFIQEVYGDVIESCEKCAKVVYHKISCVQCNKVYHMYCVKELTDKSTGEAKCLDCKSVLPKKRGELFSKSSSTTTTTTTTTKSFKGSRQQKRRRPSDEFSDSD